MGDFCKATRRSKALEEIIIFRSMLLMRYSGLSKPGPGEVVRIRTRDPRGIHEGSTRNSAWSCVVWSQCSRR
jgi:hypothetical protein